MKKPYVRLLLGLIFMAAALVLSVPAAHGGIYDDCPYYNDSTYRDMSSEQIAVEAAFLKGHLWKTSDPGLFDGCLEELKKIIKWHPNDVVFPNSDSIEIWRGECIQRRLKAFMVALNEVRHTSIFRYRESLIKRFAEKEGLLLPDNFDELFYECVKREFDILVSGFEKKTNCGWLFLQQYSQLNKFIGKYGYGEIPNWIVKLHKKCIRQQQKDEKHAYAKQYAKQKKQREDENKTQMLYAKRANKKYKDHIEFLKRCNRPLEFGKVVKKIKRLAKKYGLKLPDKATIAKWHDDCIHRRIDYFFGRLEDIIHELKYFELTLERIKEEMEAKAYNGKKLDPDRLKVLWDKCIDQDDLGRELDSLRNGGYLDFP